MWTAWAFRNCSNQVGVYEDFAAEAGVLKPDARAVVA
jgi:hypothetical protein